MREQYVFATNNVIRRELGDQREDLHSSVKWFFSLVFSSKQSTFTLRVNWTTTLLNA